MKDPPENIASGFEHTTTTIINEEKRKMKSKKITKKL